MSTVHFVVNPDSVVRHDTGRISFLGERWSTGAGGFSSVLAEAAVGGNRVSFHPVDVSAHNSFDGRGAADKTAVLEMWFTNGSTWHLYFIDPGDDEASSPWTECYKLDELINGPVTKAPIGDRVSDTTITPERLAAKLCESRPPQTTWDTDPGYMAGADMQWERGVDAIAAALDLSDLDRIRFVALCNGRVTA